MMRRTPFTGGCLLRRAASRPPQFAAFPWISFRHHGCCANKLKARASTLEDRTGSRQSVALEHVLEELRKAQGIDKLGPDVEAVVSGRGKHLGIAVSWSLRWTASGSFTEEIRGPQLTFKWGYDGRKDGGCWEVDSAGLVRVMECDDHEAVLMTTYIRTGCWLQPHLQDRFDIELLPAPVMKGAAAAGSINSSSSGCSSHRGVSSGSSNLDIGEGSSGFTSDGGSNLSEDSAVMSSSELAAAAATTTRVDTSGGLCKSSSGSSNSSSTPPTAATATVAAASDTTTATAAATHISSGGSGSTTTARGRKTAAVALTHGAPGSPAADEVVAIGLRVRGRKLRVRVFVRRRDWRLLGFNHRMCADVEMWELGEWKEWAEGVSYPSSALHKASNGGQHAYLTNSGAAERVAPLPPPPPLLLLQPPEPLRTSPPPLPRVASAEAGSLPSPPPPQQLLQLPPPTDFGLPLLPPIPGDTSYSPPGGGGGQGVPLWRAASGHYLVRPTINGQEGGGYFVVDTGASGFVLTPQAAARLGGQSFGETHAASISGKVAARFVRLGSWSLGGLSIRQPVLMVMALEGLVRGAPGEVVGIVGHDLFRRAVVEVPRVLPGCMLTAESGTGSTAIATASVAVAAPATAPATSVGSRPRSETGSSSDSDCGSGSGFEEECGSPRLGEAAASSASRDGVATATATAHISSRYAGSGAAGPVLGPPPPAARSTAAFEDPVATAAAGAAGSSGRAAAAADGGGGGKGHPVGQPCGSVALGQAFSVTAVPSPSLSLQPPSPPHLKSSPSSARSGSDTSRSSSTSSSSDVTSCSSSSSLTGQAEARSSSSNSCSSSSNNGDGSSKASSGRSPTARAVRRAARTVPYTLHEMLLYHPLEYGNELDWVWEPIVMIANLPHVHLRFADPGGGAPHAALLMVDSGACGADLMLHARAQKELGLMQMPPAAAPGAGAGDGDVVVGGGGSSNGSRSEGHYLRGVGQDPKDYVQLQVLDLPWLELAGVRFEQVRCMCAAVGGLDISIYSHGILCGDLLARLEWAIDYTHKRIGFRRGAFAHAPRPAAR